MSIYPTFAEIDLSALHNNLREVRRVVAPDCGILAVVKADAYGHGFEKIAKELDKAEVTAFGVANLAEGIQLRKSGIIRPILIFGGIFPGQEQDCIIFNLDSIIYSEEQANLLNRIAGEMCRRARVHLKVDTGMGRLGVPYEKTRYYLKALKKMKNLDLVGIASHFASADDLNIDGKNFTDYQSKRFESVVIQAKEEGISPQFIHIANSAASLTLNLQFCNLVRPGIILYGSPPAGDFNGKLDLRPVMHLKSMVAMLKRIEAGTSISYARRFVAAKKMLVASVPVGYADGYRRDLTNRGETIIRGKRARVVGTVCMDWIMLDVSHIKGISVGDEVVLLGSDTADNCITAQELADWAGTIPYEIFCGISKRIPREYVWRK